MAKDLVGLGTAIIGLAALSVLIINGGETAKVFSAFGNAFSGIIGSATHPAQSTQ